MQIQKKFVAIALTIFIVIVIGFVISNLFFNSNQDQFLEENTNQEELLVANTNQGEALEENQTTKFDLDLVCEVTNQTHNFGITCTESSDVSKQYADLTIILTNVGDVISRNTKVLLFVHNEQYPSSPMIFQSIDFPDMEPKSQGGESITKEIHFESFNVGSKEIVSVVIIDDEHSSPQNHVDSRVNLSSQVIEELQTSISKYLENQLQIDKNSGYTTIISWQG